MTPHLPIATIVAALATTPAPCGARLGVAWFWRISMA